MTGKILITYPEKDIKTKFKKNYKETEITKENKEIKGQIFTKRKQIKQGRQKQAIKDKNLKQWKESQKKKLIKLVIYTSIATKKYYIKT